jgi:16S rRNA (guanine966-N2)-methyltransferase
MVLSRIGSFEGLRVADLFAGSGALGLEALSRGARHCIFVDNDRNAVDVIRRNVERMGAGQRADVRSQSVEHCSAPPSPCDIVFLDPPYGAGLAEMALSRLCDPAWLSPGGMVSLETDRNRPAPPPGFTVEGERRFGKAHILLLRREGG